MLISHRAPPGEVEVTLSRPFLGRKADSANPNGMWGCIYISASAKINYVKRHYRVAVPTVRTAPLPPSNFVSNRLGYMTMGENDWGLERDFVFLPPCRRHHCPRRSAIRVSYTRFRATSKYTRCMDSLGRHCVTASLRRPSLFLFMNLTATPSLVRATSVVAYPHGMVQA